MTRPIKCQRCTPQLKCLNCKSDLGSAKFLGTCRYKANLVADAIPIQGRFK